MSSTIACPGCGAANAADATQCTQCNYPFVDTFPRATPAPTVPAAEAAPAPATAKVAEPVKPRQAPPGPEVRGFDPGPRPVRRTRTSRAAMEPIQMQIVGAVAIAVVIGLVYFAAQGAMKTNAPAVAGADPRMQQAADAARATLDRDSTNLAARIDLANVLYDTANWSEAIIHYKSAMRLDPQRVTTVVDLGVCYYNLGHFAAAESLFTHALTVHAEHPIALFNLGIVAETQNRFDEALGFFHRAMRSNPPAEVRSVLEEHIKNVMAKTGKQPPPLKN